MTTGKHCKDARKQSNNQDLFEMKFILYYQQKFIDACTLYMYIYIYPVYTINNLRKVIELCSISDHILHFLKTMMLEEIVDIAGLDISHCLSTSGMSNF